MEIFGFPVVASNDLPKKKDAHITLGNFSAWNCSAYAGPVDFAEFRDFVNSLPKRFGYLITPEMIDAITGKRTSRELRNSLDEWINGLSPRDRRSFLRCCYGQYRWRSKRTRHRPHWKPGKGGRRFEYK